jgi:cytochrome c553
LSYTQTQLDALKAARARGVTRLRMGNEEVEFRSDAEMATLIAEIEASLTSTPRQRTRVAQFSRGDD